MIHCGSVIAAGVSQGKSTTFRKDLGVSGRLPGSWCLEPISTAAFTGSSILGARFPHDDFIRVPCCCPS